MREVIVKYLREKKNRVFSASEQLLRDAIRWKRVGEEEEEEEATEHADVRRIENGILEGEKKRPRERERQAIRRALRLGDGIAR